MNDSLNIKEKTVIIERSVNGSFNIYANFKLDKVLFLDSLADEYNTPQEILLEYEEIQKLKTSDEFNLIL